ncbi:ABC transporter permease [Pseudochryseolinea flava]|uniref:ABC transporter permease n=1 Tax=Pseudochryseolinea flava TaxID=2059302 RepID=A0A364XYF0_9BACT|nr:ABC transporter permease [Pseudochryseolinea flava]RAV99529.1 ABC transporter permease [Pseudochryseolinea flava]
MFPMFKVAARFLAKYRSYTLINVGGLSLSLACVTFIGLYIHDELTFDHQHENHSQIYRVIETEKADDGAITKVADVGFQLANLKEQFPDITNATRITTFGRANLTGVGTENTVHDPLNIVDQGFMDIFDFAIVHGSRKDALTQPNTAVITQSAAIKLFGKTDVVDEMISNDRDQQTFRVTAVLEDFPTNSHIQGNMFFSIASFAQARWYVEEMPNDWDGNNFATYMLLKGNASVKKLEKLITEETKRHLAPESATVAIGLQPMDDVHFYSADILGGFASNPGAISYMYILTAVGLFILLIASINYVNLSTSLSITRGKEVAVKKVAGASRFNLIVQFIVESNMISLLALVIAFVLVNALLPLFNTFTGKTIELEHLWRPEIIGTIVLFTVVTGTLSGCYPAFFLSALKPSAAIKGAKSAGGGTLRQALVVFQFGLAVMLILATFVAWDQLSFIQNKHLGFDHNQIIVMDINTRDVRRGADVVKEEIKKLPHVQSVSLSSRVPGEWKNLLQVGTRTFQGPVQDKSYFIGIDEDFLATFNIDLVEGRNFQAGNIADTSAYLINESAAELLGLKSPVGADITLESMSNGSSEEQFEKPLAGKIIGVVKDFHFQSLHQKIAPLVLAYRQNEIQPIDYFSVRVDGGNMPETLKGLASALHKVDPAHLLEYNFLDDRLGDFYKQDARHGQIFGLAASVAIALACLGLFALASFMTEQRTKEIGIRKVLGATSAQIVVMLSNSYLKLVVIAFVIAAPIAVWLLGQWLESFAYHVPVTWGSIVGTCGICVLIALVTVGYKSLQTAVANPVKSLRSE